MSSLSLFFFLTKGRKKKLALSERELLLLLLSPLFSPHDAGQHRPPPGLWPPRQHRRQQWKPPQRRPRRRGGLDPVFVEQLDVDHQAIISLPFDRQHGHPKSPRRQDPGAAGENAREGGVLDAKRETARERARREEQKNECALLSLSASSTPYQTRSFGPSFRRGLVF